MRAWEWALVLVAVALLATLLAPHLGGCTPTEIGLLACRALP